MNEPSKNDTRKGYPAQGLIVWPHGIRGAAVIYPLGATEEETEVIRRMLNKAIKRGSKD
jgi:hypothetical protein